MLTAEQLTRDVDQERSYQLVTPHAAGPIRSSWDLAALDAVAAGVAHFVGPGHLRFTDEFSVIQRRPWW